jgi:hypothetical protein
VEEYAFVFGIIVVIRSAAAFFFVGIIAISSLGASWCAFRCSGGVCIYFVGIIAISSLVQVVVRSASG